MENNLTINKEIAYDTAVSILGVKQFVAYLAELTGNILYCDVLSKVLCSVFYSMCSSMGNRIIAFEDIVMSIGSYFARKTIGDALVEWGKYNVTTPHKYNVTTPHKDGAETYRMALCHFATRKPNLVEMYWEFPLPLLGLMYGIGSNCENINDVKDFIKKHNIKIEKVTE